MREKINVFSKEDNETYETADLKIIIQEKKRPNTFKQSNNTYLTGLTKYEESILHSIPSVHNQEASGVTWKI